MVNIEFETVEGDTFAHITSTSGVLGHAKEVRDKVPRGTFLTIPSKLFRLTPWLIKKCGFRHAICVIYENDVMDILIKE